MTAPTERMVGRVAASVLAGAGLQLLIARTPGEYEALAGALAADAGRRWACRGRTVGAKRGPLFDPTAWVRKMESAAAAAWDAAEAVPGAMPHLSVGGGA